MRSKRFEAWFAHHNGIPVEEVEAMFTGRTYESWDYYVETAWAAWCAALGFEEGAA
jgi:uncharacterized membrane protein